MDASQCVTIYQKIDWLNGVICTSLTFDYLYTWQEMYLLWTVPIIYLIKVHYYQSKGNVSTTCQQILEIWKLHCILPSFTCKTFSWGVDIFVIQLISVLESAEILPTRLKTQNNKSMYYSTISVYIILWSLSSRCSCIYNQLQQQNDIPF